MSIMDATSTRDKDLPLIEHLQSVAASRLASAGKRRKQLLDELKDLAAGDEERILFAAKARLSGRRISDLSRVNRLKVDKIIADAKATGELDADEIR